MLLFSKLAETNRKFWINWDLFSIRTNNSVDTFFVSRMFYLRRSNTNTYAVMQTLLLMVVFRLRNI